MLGSVFLKDYYSIYDLDNYRIGLAPVYDFDAPAESNEVDQGDGEIEEIDDIGDDEADGDSSAASFVHDNLRNGLIFGGFFLGFIVLACYVCKRRRNE